MEEKLKELNIKITRQRLAILDIFTKYKCPIKAELILNELHKNDADINETTIYRNLNIFVEYKIISKVDFGKDSIYYELCNHHHHHIVCTKCDIVEDFDSNEIEKSIESVISSSSKFIKIERHSLELFGVCNNCK